MAAKSADAEYLDRMLGLHPGRDAARIITERASYVAARAAGDGVSAGNSSAARGARDATRPRLLPERWFEQTIEVDVPLRAGDGKDEGRPGPRDLRRWWVVGWIVLTALGKLATMLASRP